MDTDEHGFRRSARFCDPQQTPSGSHIEMSPLRGVRLMGFIINKDFAPDGAYAGFRVVLVTGP